MANEKKVAREPSFLLALIPIVAMIGFMLYCFLGHSESGVQAVCSFYGLSLYNFLEAGDVLEESGYDVANLRGANHDLGKLYIALETALRI